GFFLSRGASADYLNVNGFNSCHYAVSAGRPDLLEFLLDWDTEADPLADERVVGLIPFFTLNKEYETAVSLLNILFDRGISPNSRDGNERTLMDQAITYSLPLASYILSSGASPDLVSPGGVTPMMKLMTMNMEGDFSLLHELAAAGADMRVKDDEGKSIMLYAVLYGQSPDVLKTLMELGISIDIRDDYGTPAFFFVSAFQNSPDFQLPLLSEDERFLRRDKDGWTPLHGALNFGNAPELIDTLATLYPDGYLIDGTGRSLEEFRTAYEELYGPQDMPELTRLIGSRRIYPAGELPLFFDPDEELRIIVEKGRDPELVSLFIAEGADLSLHYSDGFSPVLTASAFNSAAMVRALLDEGATVFDSTPYGWTPLHVASWRSDPETAALLIEEGLNVNARDFDYWTPLHWAARNNPSREYLEILLASGADPALKTYRNDTPLHLACQGWVEPSSDTIELLLQGGADIDAPNASGATALMLAAGQGYGEACRLLLASGADNRRTDSDGMTAAMWAAERQYDDLAEFLREAE
ncbi:MAG: ankyrin repeat domain-containing protein, partial [Spirochaetales bacterium]|nr:ankyrin repeat domain-containing protein [Spirochaetales bacterium]